MHPHSINFSSLSPISPKATPSKRRVLGEIQNSFRSPMTERKNSPLIERVLTPRNQSPLIDHNSCSPLTSRLPKRSSTKISKIFEERTKFKKSNKENQSPMMSETFMRFQIEEETRDSAFGDSVPSQDNAEGMVNWSMAKLDFSELNSEFNKTEQKDDYVPEKEMDTDLDPDMETLHDLEEEFENDNFDTCTKYEIISTDSPNIISRGRLSTSTKINSKNFQFGAPLADTEASTSFNTKATRMLTFEDEFEFTSPALRRSSSGNVKKSLKFNETPTKNDPSQAKTDFQSPKLRIFNSNSTSMESGFVSEFDEFLEIEESSNSPKIANLNELLSGTIKNPVSNNIQRPVFSRSISLNPDRTKARVNLFSITESPVGKKSQKRQEPCENVSCSKKRKSSCDSSVIDKISRPVLQRALSENNASIMSALARSADNPDLIGDFSGPYLLPLTAGLHSDLKSISCDTLQDLLDDKYKDVIDEYKIIDCRYPYEFEGGHIEGAVNLYTPEQLNFLLNTPPPSNKKVVLVFHCELSQQRGPDQCRRLRALDRSRHKAYYPHLAYPELYILEGGYRSWFSTRSPRCTPRGYTEMRNKAHALQLTKHRSLKLNKYHSAL